MQCPSLRRVSLTKVLLAILLHGDLHFALGSFAMGFTICCEKGMKNTNKGENHEKKETGYQFFEAFEIRFVVLHL